MQYLSVMDDCEKYIEEHLEYPPTATELAELSGYSLYHFCHLFRAHFGVSVGEYIKQKKLEKAAENIAAGMSITESAIRAGYETTSGFAKAFRKEYGTTASEYRKNHKKLIPAFEGKESFFAAGYCIIPSEKISEKESSAYWKNIDFKDQPPYPENLEDCGEIAAWIRPNEENGKLSYFFGFETLCKNPPEGFVSINIPKANYAVFELSVSVFDKNLSAELSTLWKRIFDEWFPSTQKIFDEEKMCFEFYKGEKVFVYIPIK